MSHLEALKKSVDDVLALPCEHVNSREGQLQRQLRAAVTQVRWALLQLNNQPKEK